MDVVRAQDNSLKWGTYPSAVLCVLNRLSPDLLETFRPPPGWAPSCVLHCLHHPERYPAMAFVVQMYQAKLFENEHTLNLGFRKYGSSQHFHTVFKNIGHPKAYNGARMVASTITEMLANVSHLAHEESVRNFTHESCRSSRALQQ